MGIKKSSNTSNTTEYLLGVTIDYELKFEEHVLSICNKATKKLSALGRVPNFMNFENRWKIFKALLNLNSVIAH